MCRALFPDPDPVYAKGDDDQHYLIGYVDEHGLKTDPTYDAMIHRKTDGPDPLIEESGP